MGRRGDLTFCEWWLSVQGLNVGGGASEKYELSGFFLSEFWVLMSLWVLGIIRNFRLMGQLFEVVLWFPLQLLQREGFDLLGQALSSWSRVQ